MCFVQLWPLKWPILWAIYTSSVVLAPVSNTSLITWCVLAVPRPISLHTKCQHEKYTCSVKTYKWCSFSLVRMWWKTHIGTWKLYLTRIQTCNAEFPKQTYNHCCNWCNDEETMQIYKPTTILFVHKTWWLSTEIDKLYNPEPNSLVYSYTLTRDTQMRALVLQFSMQAIYGID